MKKRLLSLLLAALMCFGLFGILPGTAASSDVASWDAAALAAAATATGTVGKAGGPIFTTENQAIGVTLTSNGYRVPAGDFAIPLYDAEGNPLIYAGDTITFEAYIWAEDEDLDTGHAARMRLLWPDSDSHAYNDKTGPDQPNMATAIISRDNFRALDTLNNPVYGDYKIISMEYTVTDEDMARLEGETYIAASIAGQGVWFDLYYMAAYNSEIEMLLNEAWGFDWAHYTERDAYVKDFSFDKTEPYQFIYEDDSEGAMTNLVTYTNAWGPRANTSDATKDYIAYSPASSDATVLVNGLTQELTAGTYSYTFDLNTQLVCNAETPLVTVRAMGKTADGERTELAKYDYMLNESVADKAFFSYRANDWAETAANNWGPQFSEVKLDFELTQDMTVDFEVVVYNNADVRLRSVNLTREVSQAEVQGTGLAEEIAAIGEITAANCLTMAEELEALKADLNAYITEFGQDKADQYITNQAALTTALEQAGTLKTERLAKRDEVQQKIDAVAALTVTEENVDECDTAVQAAEAAVTEYTTAYGDDAKADLTGIEALDTAKTAIEDIRNKPTFTYGKVNDDDKIDASDALMALQHSVELVKLEGNAFSAANVNADDKVDAADALLILQYSVELIEKFPAEQVAE